jgi:hypothetical protein
VSDWGLLWRSCSFLDGRREHLIREDCLVKMFRTRREARAYAQEKYGYIKTREDLRREPHGWRMPAPVRVSILPRNQHFEVGG